MSDQNTDERRPLLNDKKGKSKRDAVSYSDHRPTSNSHNDDELPNQAHFDNEGTSRRATDSSDAKDAVPSSQRPGTSGPEQKQSAKAKGKRKAIDPIHNTDSAVPDSRQDEEQQAQHSRLVTIICWLLLVLVVLILILLGFIHFFVGRTIESISASPGGLQGFGQKSLVWAGPDHLVLNSVEDHAVYITATGRAGINVARGFDRERKKGFLDRIQYSLTKWGVSKMKDISINAGLQDVQVSQPNEPVMVLLPDLPSFSLPIRWQPVNSHDAAANTAPEWLRAVESPIKVQFASTDALVRFVNSSWNDKVAQVSIKVPQVSLQPGGFAARLGRLSRFSLQDLESSMRFDIPNMPFLDNPAKLVNLTSYSISPRATEAGQSTSNETLHIQGFADVQNPVASDPRQFPAILQPVLAALGNATYSLPAAVPFEVYLHGNLTNGSTHDEGEAKFARVAINPIHFFLRQPNIPISISGIVAGSDPRSPYLEPGVSSLISRYLAGHATPISIRPLPDESTLPAFVKPILKLIPSVTMEVPGSPDPDAELLQNVRIEGMRVDGTGPNSEILCSGKVMGDLNLPAGLEGMGSVMDVQSLWPDLLVFDGKVPHSQLPPPEKGKFPPHLLPETAFARLRPENWTKAHKTIVKRPDPLHPGRTFDVIRIEMDLEEVPLTVLPGRSSIVRGYLAKILFKAGDGPGGTVATSIWGLSQLRLALPRLGNLTLSEVAIQGSFYVARPSL